MTTATQHSPESDEARRVEEDWSYQCLLRAKSALMGEVRALVDRVRGVDVTVLIQGESGTGKEVVANALHATSIRRHGPFVRVNCAALPDDLVENELFGSEPGAFTGAVQEKPGKFELAHGGTLFLDEIGDLVPRLQAKLLHALQEGEVTRLGSVEPRSVDVRVIAATSRDLEAALHAGGFREDLYYRLNVVNITLPPLRERREDVLDLAEYFLGRYARHYRRDAPALVGPVREFLLRYDWPGNVREVENVMKRFVLIGESAIQDDLTATRIPPDESLKDVSRAAAKKLERARILQALEETHWNRRRAASTLQISYRSLLYKLKDICETLDQPSRVSTH
jgi:transcriptional regulator with PAS, ATPase and Fis domain